MWCELYWVEENEKNQEKYGADVEYLQELHTYKYMENETGYGLEYDLKKK